MPALWQPGAEPQEDLAMASLLTGLGFFLIAVLLHWHAGSFQGEFGRYQDEGMHYITGEAIGHSAFATAFVLVGMTTILAMLPFLALPKDAGSSVSGHRVRGPAGEEPPVV